MGRKKWSILPMEYDNLSSKTESSKELSEKDHAYVLDKYSLYGYFLRWQMLVSKVVIATGIGEG